ncbi:hypothetical protein SDC9_122880 [bioreactor metagenome]|uniref:Uncharacterized protein n=1 Tax=bioreactor metagenome TaxID=1076179 RepID=A0A645CFW7_9ZZZZ
MGLWTHRITEGDRANQPLFHQDKNTGYSLFVLGRRDVDAELTCMGRAGNQNCRTIDVPADALPLDCRDFVHRGQFKALGGCMSNDAFPDRMLRMCFNRCCQSQHLHFRIGPRVGRCHIGHRESTLCERARLIEHNGIDFSSLLKCCPISDEQSVLCRFGS